MLYISIYHFNFSNRQQQTFTHAIHSQIQNRFYNGYTLLLLLAMAMEGTYCQLWTQQTFIDFKLNIKASLSALYK